jgi:hypothetical protein
MRMLSPVADAWVAYPYGPATRRFAETRPGDPFWAPRGD